MIWELRGGPAKNGTPPRGFFAGSGCRVLRAGACSLNGKEVQIIMIRTTKRVMTILLTLCLIAAWLPAAALASGSVSISTTDSLTAGTAGGEVTLTATGDTFADAVLNGSFTIISGNEDDSLSQNET